MLNENMPESFAQAEENIRHEEKLFELDCKKGDDFNHENLFNENDIPRPVCKRYEDLDCENCGLINNAQCETGVDYMIEVECKEKGNHKCSECGSYDTDTKCRDNWQGKVDVGGLIPLQYICNQCGNKQNV